MLAAVKVGRDIASSSNYYDSTGGIRLAGKYLYLEKTGFLSGNYDCGLGQVLIIEALGPSGLGHPLPGLLNLALSERQRPLEDSTRASLGPE